MGRSQAYGAPAMTDAYLDWARGFHGHAFRRRSAERNAAFLLPRLEAGQRVVDIGCGPGAITAGLAQRVAPGPVIGIDRDAAYVAAATGQHRLPNLRFEEGDAASLPIADDAVDVAFLHFVLQHVDSPAAVLREVRRVVRPGGLVAVADADLEGFLIHPRSAALDAALLLDGRTRRNPQLGRQLPQLLTEAGFDAVEFSVVPNVAIGDAVAAVSASTTARLEAPAFMEHAVAQGWSTASDLAEMAAAWRHWATQPGAVFVTLTCQALAS